MAEDQTYAEAQKILNAIRVLEQMEAEGSITDAGQQYLDEARMKRKPAEQATAETISTYRGFQSGITLRLADEARGAYEMANAFVKSRDLEKAREAYKVYRDLVRMKDEAAKLIAPDQFSKGDAAGQLAAVVSPTAGMQRILQGLSKAKQILAGLGTGATASALPEFAGGEGGFSNRLKEVSPTGTAISAGFGGVAPVAGNIAQGTMRGISNIMRGGDQGFSGSALRTVGQRVNSAENAGQNIREYLQSLGPEGMIADVAGGPRGQAQALATMQGEGADVLRQRIEDRASAAGARVEDTMTSQIDAPNAGFDEKIAQRAERSEVISPMYEAATQSDQLFDLSTLRRALVLYGGQVGKASRKEMSALLRDLGSDGPITAEKLHNVRSELSDVIFENRGKAAAVNLRPFLTAIDDKLDEIPGYAEARSRFASSSAIDRAVDEGVKIFSGGRISSVSPKELEVMLNKMTDAEREAFKKGARDYIGALMGTSRNDAAAAWGEFAKGWNAEKLRLIVGDDAAKEVTRRLFAEKMFSETRSDVLKGSQTQFRREGAESLGDIREPDTMNAPTPVQRIKSKILDEPVNALINEIVYGSRTSNLNRQIGEILTLQGDQRDAVVEVLFDEVRRMQNPTRKEKILNALTTAGITGYGSTVGQD